MIEIKYEQANKLYSEVRNIILERKDESGYHYQKKQHYLYERDASPELRASYYNESGSVEIQNISDETIIIEINRWHAHKHNGMSGLNGTPCLSAVISIKENDEKKKIWELKVGSGTMYYKAETTSLELPIDRLQEVPVLSEEHSTEQIIEEIVESRIEDNIPQEKRNLFEMLRELHDNYLIAEQDKEEILSERDLEIKKATESIIASYSERMSQNDKALGSSKKELADFDQLIYKYSTFNSKLIGRILAQLVSLIEGEEYSYQQATHDTTEGRSTPFGGETFKVQNNVLMIVRGNQTSGHYSDFRDYDSEIRKLVKNGKAILLSEKGYRDDREMTFCYASNGKVNCSVDFGRFDYAKEFVDNVIQYRFQNGIEKINEKDLLLCMSAFVSNNKELITSNYHSRVEEKILKMKLSNS